MRSAIRCAIKTAKCALAIESLHKRLMTVKRVMAKSAPWRNCRASSISLQIVCSVGDCFMPSVWAKARSCARSRIVKGYHRYQHLSLVACVMSRPNGLAFSCRERAGKAFKIRPISRAKRSAAMPGWAARVSKYAFRVRGWVQRSVDRSGNASKQMFINNRAMSLSNWILWLIAPTTFRCAVPDVSN